MKKIAFFMACFSMLFGQAPEWADEQKALEQAKTLRWKATVFAGAVLLAIATGVAVISIDGGTPNHQKRHKDWSNHHKDHSHHGDHRRDHCHQDHRHSDCHSDRHCRPDQCCNDFDVPRNPFIYIE